MRIKRLLSWALIAGGLLLLADGALTLPWKEPVSAVYASIQQNKLAGELEKLEQVEPTPPRRRSWRGCPTPGSSSRSRRAPCAGGRRTGSRSGA